MSWVAAVVGVGTAAYSVIDSANKKSAANKLAKSNVRPIYTPAGEIEDVSNLAFSEINNTGLQDYATQQLGQNQSAGIDAILKSGGRADFGTINNTYGSQLQAVLATLSKNRDAKIAAANNAAYNLAKSKDAAFQYNEDAPYKDAKQQEATLRQQAAAGNAQAISTLASTAANYGIATTQAGQYGVGDLGTSGLQERSNADPSLLARPDAATGATVGSLPLSNDLLAAAGRPTNIAAPAPTPNGAVNTSFNYGGSNVIIGYDDITGQPLYAP